MDSSALLACPAKPEDADWRQDGGNHGQRQSSLWELALAAVLIRELYVKLVRVASREYRKQDPHTDPHEGSTCRALSPVIVEPEDDRIGL